MRKLAFLIFLFPIFVQAQGVSEPPKTSDPNKMNIQPNILRLLFSTATDSKLSISANYEREIKKPITVVVGGGPTYFRIEKSTDIFGNKKYESSVNFFISGELRCYYNLKRRMKQEKTVRNFSAFYASLQEQLISKPILVFNRTGEYNLQNKNGAFVNIGYQFQKITTYYNLYFGIRFPGKIYRNAPSGIELLHGSISVGRAF